MIPSLLKKINIPKCWNQQWLEQRRNFLSALTPSVTALNSPAIKVSPHWKRLCRVPAGTASHQTLSGDTRTCTDRNQVTVWSHSLSPCSRDPRPIAHTEPQKDAWLRNLPCAFSDIWQNICRGRGQRDDRLVCSFPFTIQKIKIEMTAQYVFVICVLVPQVLTDNICHFMPAKEKYYSPAL